MGLFLIKIASFFYIEKQFLKIEELDIIAKVISIKEEKDYKDKYVVKILNDNLGDSQLKNITKESSSLKYENQNKIKNSKIIIYVDKDNTFFPGDIVSIKGSFSMAESKRNYLGFDYRKYLKMQEIYGILEAEEIYKIGKSEDFLSMLEKLRLNFLNKIDKFYLDEEGEFLKSLLLGKTDGLSEKIEENFRDSSISHVLAISGMHVSYIIIGIKFLLDKIIKSKKLKNYILISFLLIFYLLTGGAVSALRACIMSSLILISSNCCRKNNFYISFIFSFIIIIFLNPYNIFNIGLWLSYMGTLGIVLIYPFLKKILYHKFSLKKKMENKNILSKFINSVIDNLLVTVSAQVLIFPIMIYVFNTISISFFVSNILISIFVGPVLILGYITIFADYIWFPISKIIIFFEKILINLILKIAEVCAKLPFSKIIVITPNFIFVIAFYIAVLFIVYCFYKKKIYMIKLLISFTFLKKQIVKIINVCIQKFDKNKENQLFNKRNALVKVLIFIIIFVNISSQIYKKNNILEINFVDVGQGDCTYIKTPKGKNIIIDGGEGNSDKYNYGEKVLLPYLLDKQVSRINYLIATHADSDHIGGLFAILENIKVDKVLIGIQPEVSEQFEDLEKIAKQKNIEIIFLKAGNKLTIEKDIYINVLWPIETKLIGENELNNNSLVFKFTYNNFSALFTGDIEEVAERQMVDVYKEKGILNSTLLKVAHHGSKSSSINLFLEEVKPQIALIGVGKNNNFGHPNIGVLERLKSYKTKVFRTDENGEINIFITKEGKIKIKTIY